MSKIQVLDQITIDKIAAGEVIERPASIVKELAENAIDAGAGAIVIEIKEGGISFIRITDNGCGIAKEDVSNAFLRHSTSKIRSVDDLMDIHTLGFRGEALSSIAAVSRVELITKTRENDFGITYRIEGGKEISIEETGAPDGTTFLVRQLFYNTPARRKFLKTPMTEASHVADLVTRLALSHPEISFQFINNGQSKIHTSGNGNLKDVIYHIYGRDIASHLLEVKAENEHLKLTGYIGEPIVSRGNRNFENYYINGRYVKSKLLMKAIEEAYKPYMMQHKYPFVCLHYTIEGESIDVNVHPTKMEVRFQNQSAVYNATYDAISEALGGKEMSPEVELEKKERDIKKQKITAPEPFETVYKQQQNIEKSVSYVREDPQLYAPKSVGLKPATGSFTISQVTKPRTQENLPTVPVIKEAPLQEKKEPDVVPKQTPKQMELFEDALLSPKARLRHRIIGQLFDTYWLVEYEDKFYIIDQHAAHEKVLYEKLLKEYANKDVLSQMISPAQVISLNLQEDAIMKANMEVFREFGFEISEFGGREYSIHAVPVDLYGSSVQEFFVEILDSLENEHAKQPLELITGKLATAACKAAVKGNNTLSLKEADQLIDQLLGLDNPYHCPHGRPTIVSMTKYELEKKFKRIV